jgi:hypothetical protein
MTELAQAVIDDEPTAAVEFANEVFDEESGKLLKYRKLITHPKHCKVWMHSSANKLGRLAQGEVAESRALIQYFLSANTQFQKTGEKT